MPTEIHVSACFSAVPPLLNHQCAGATELHLLLQQRFHIELPATVAFDYGTIRGIAEEVAARLHRRNLEASGTLSVSRDNGSWPLVNQAPLPATQPLLHAAQSPDVPPATLEEILLELEQIALSLLGRGVDRDEPLHQAGLDSLGSETMQQQVAARFGVSLAPTFVYDHPSLLAMAQHIVGLRAADGSAGSSPERLQAKLSSAPSSAISLTGLWTRLPMADGARNWREVANDMPTAASLAGPIPLQRWDLQEVYAPESSHSATTYARFATLCTGVDAFDPEALRISVGESLLIDPQVRLLLEGVHALATEAGALPAPASVAVFSGCMYHEYLSVLTRASRPALPPAAAFVGTGPPYMVGRIAFTFGFRGPTACTDTACSSSLVSTHLASSALRAGEAAGAVVTGSNLLLDPATTVGISRLGALAVSGRCLSFDAAADGYGRGEGFVAAALQVADLAAATTSLAILAGSAVNLAGRGGGLTAPNGPAQTQVVLAALQRSGAAALGALSCHGTGTALGDPLEITALTGALPAAPVLLSTKSCWGHTEGAAGLVGALGALSALAHREAAPISHLRSLNPYVGSALSGFAGRPAALPRQRGPLFEASAAGTSSFGMSGVNAHAVWAAEPACDRLCSGPSALLTQRQVLWPLPPVAEAVQRFWPTGGALGSKPDARFAIIATRPSLSYLHDHKVSSGEGHLGMDRQRGWLLSSESRVPQAVFNRWSI